MVETVGGVEPVAIRIRYAVVRGATAAWLSSSPHLDGRNFPTPAVNAAAMLPSCSSPGLMIATSFALATACITASGS